VLIASFSGFDPKADVREFWLWLLHHAKSAEYLGELQRTPGFTSASTVWQSVWLQASICFPRWR